MRCYLADGGGAFVLCAADVQSLSVLSLAALNRVGRDYALLAHHPLQVWSSQHLTIDNQT